MKALDYTIKSKQITPTVDYTEVLYLIASQEYVVVWHDNILSTHDNEKNAVKEYNRIIHRRKNGNR